MEVVIVPYSEAAFWQEIGKWVAGIFTTAAAFFGMVKKWHGDRFMKIEADVKSNANKIVDHDIKFARIDSNMGTIKEDTTEIKDSIRRLHDRMDKAG